MLYCLLKEQLNSTSRLPVQLHVAEYTKRRDAVHDELRVKSRERHGDGDSGKTAGNRGNFYECHGNRNTAGVGTSATAIPRGRGRVPRGETAGDGGSTSLFTGQVLCPQHWDKHIYQAE